MMLYTYSKTPLVSLVLICLVLFNCTKKAGKDLPVANGKLNGIHKFYYPEGELYLEVNYKDSIPNGTLKKYLRDGTLIEQSEYVNGQLHGSSIKYYESGSLYYERFYDSGRLHGIQKKYRSDGLPAYEAPYFYDKPCVGLKEYYTSGKPRDKYPNIIIKVENRLLQDNQYVVTISLSEPVKEVQFYNGSIIEGKYISKDAKGIYTNNGFGVLNYFLTPGDFVMERLNIIAKIKTDLGNYYITQRSYNLAAENRY